jgi:hypothetical protein
MPRIEGRSKYRANTWALNTSLWPRLLGVATLLRPQLWHTYCCFLPDSDRSFSASRCHNEHTVWLPFLQLTQTWTAEPLPAFSTGSKHKSMLYQSSITQKHEDRLIEQRHTRELTINSINDHLHIAIIINGNKVIPLPHFIASFFDHTSNENLLSS